MGVKVPALSTIFYVRRVAFVMCAQPVLLYEADGTNACTPSIPTASSSIHFLTHAVFRTSITADRALGRLAAAAVVGGRRRVNEGQAQRSLHLRVVNARAWYCLNH